MLTQCIHNFFRGFPNLILIFISITNITFNWPLQIFRQNCSLGSHTTHLVNVNFILNFMAGPTP